MRRKKNKPKVGDGPVEEKKPKFAVEFKEEVIIRDTSPYAFSRSLYLTLSEAENVFVELGKVLMRKGNA